MKNIILIVDGETFEFDNINELKKHFKDDYDKISPAELTNFMYERAFGFSMINGIQIIDTNKGVFGSNYEMENTPIDINNSIIINNLDTYILSLCKYNAITLLEEKNNRNYTKDLNVDIGENNYINVNAFANEILLALAGDNN